MKRLNTLIVLGLVVLVLACSKSPEQVPATNSGTSQSAATLPKSTATQPGTVPSSTAGSTAMATKTDTAPGMNPPHGQPGHRCEIPVGAPLDTPAGPRTVQPSTVQPNVTVQSGTPPTTAPGMNPPHGQPGHRCDIKVGAPLNSAPAAGK